MSCSTSSVKRPGIPSHRFRTESSGCRYPHAHSRRFAKASQPGMPVNFDVPAGACDCHTHIHGDPEKSPFFAGRVYTPEMALPEEMTALHVSWR